MASTSMRIVLALSAHFCALPAPVPPWDDDWARVSPAKAGEAGRVGVRLILDKLTIRPLAPGPEPAPIPASAADADAESRSLAALAKGIHRSSPPSSNPRPRRADVRLIKDGRRAKRPQVEMDDGELGLEGEW